MVPMDSGSTEQQSQPVALPKAINELIKDEQFHQAGSNEGLFVYPSYPCDERYLCCNVFSGKQYVARLISPISPDEKASDKGAAQLFLHFCNYAAELYLRYADDRYVRHQNDRLHQLVKTIIQQPGERSAKKAESVLRDYGWEMSHSYSVVKLRFFEGVEPEGTALYLSKQLLSEWPHSCALSLENCIVWVVNLTLSETRLAVQSFDQSLAYIVREYICKAGISDMCNDFLNLRSYYIQAEAALEIGQKRDPHFWNYRFDSYILAYMLEQMTGDFSGEQLCSKALYTLREYDMKYNTEYSKTLYYYISCRFNISLAAKKMYVHRTTFIRRLERIREISGIDIDNADELLHLLLSYKLLES
jgi:sugar diacid utilization regulator